MERPRPRVHEHLHPDHDDRREDDEIHGGSRFKIDGLNDLRLHPDERHIPSKRKRAMNAQSVFVSQILKEVYPRILLVLQRRNGRLSEMRQYSRSILLSSCSDTSRGMDSRCSSMWSSIASYPETEIGVRNNIC